MTITPPTQQTPFIIVLGNEKGGTGKSTISMHVIVHLLRLGFQVGSIDIDARQGTLSRYIENRLSFCQTRDITLPHSSHFPILKSTLAHKGDIENDERDRLTKCLEELKDKNFIVIDTPGTDSYLSRVAHSHADLLITPLNDSFVDLDMLARVDSQTGDIIRPSTYSEMVWEQKKQRAIRGLESFDWLVLRNRLSSIHAKNKEDMRSALDQLAQRVKFRVCKGFGERVIFRELFLKGLTVLDLADAGIELTLSHVAARQELRSLIQEINLPVINSQLALAS
jgi:chromosome partitioning protein